MPRRRPRSLPAFTETEKKRAHLFLASRVATMMGRKLEEADWTQVYCAAKGIPYGGWSNLSIDVVHEGLGVEQKMVRGKKKGPITESCGESMMHPAATRSIRIPSGKASATEIARDVLGQYAELIEGRRQLVQDDCPGCTPDMRTGWLLWQDGLREFLYFEEEMLPPDPTDYVAEWHKSGGGSRKASRNLWVYERDSGVKRYSITTSAGPKVQPYFDVPPADDPNVYVFVVQGERRRKGLVRMWVTPTTALLLKKCLGGLDSGTLSSAILDAAKGAPEESSSSPAPEADVAREVVVSETAYAALLDVFGGTSDEHRMQLLIKHITGG